MAIYYTYIHIHHRCFVEDALRVEDNDINNVQNEQILNNASHLLFYIKVPIDRIFDVNFTLIDEI